LVPANRHVRKPLGMSVDRGWGAWKEKRMRTLSRGVYLCIYDTILFES